MADSQFSAAELAECAERETRKRQAVYPRLIEHRKMTQAQGDRQIAMMQAIATKLRVEADADDAKGDLFG